MNPETTQRDLLEIIQRLERLETSGNISKRTASGIRIQKEILERVLIELDEMGSYLLKLKTRLQKSEKKSRELEIFAWLVGYYLNLVQFDRDHPRAESVLLRIKEFYAELNTGTKEDPQSLEEFRRWIQKALYSPVEVIPIDQVMKKQAERTMVRIKHICQEIDQLIKERGFVNE